MSKKASQIKGSNMKGPICENTVYGNMKGSNGQQTKKAIEKRKEIMGNLYKPRKTEILPKELSHV